MKVFNSIMDGYVYWNVEIFDFGECEGIDEF
jgi:hypothetical protein